MNWKTQLPPISVRTPMRSGRARYLVLALLIAVCALALYHRITEQVVLGGASSVEQRHARLHDLGGVWLIALQLPVSAVVTGLVFLFLRGSVSPGRLRRMWAVHPRVWLACAVGISVALNAAWLGFVLDGGISVEDDHAYLFQAVLIAHGHVTLDTPWSGFGSAFCWPWTFGGLDRFASFQMPGHCFFLALGVLLKYPWVVPVLEGGVMVAATHAAARKLFGRRTAMITTLLLSTSPYVLSTNGSYSAAASVAMCVSLVLLAAAPVLKGRLQTRSAAALGATIALLWFVRPPAALICAIPIGIMMLRMAPRASRWRRNVLVTLATAAIGTAPYLAYCKAVTGAWSLSPGNVYSSRLASPEISPHNIVSSQGHDLIDWIPNVITSLVRLNCYLFGWPLSLAPLAVLVWRRAWRGPTGCLLFMCVLLFGFYCLSEKILGWYYYELMPCLAILGARGLVELSRVPLTSGSRRPMATHRATALLMACCAAAVLVTLPLSMLRRAQFVREWTAASRWVSREISEDRALVFFNPDGVDKATALALSGVNDPYLSHRIIYARSNQDPGFENDLRRRFPSRVAYRYDRDKATGMHSLRPLRARP